MSEARKLDLHEILKVVKKRKWFVIYITLFTTMLTFVVSCFFIGPMYKGVTSIVIVKESAKLFYEDRYTDSDIMMYQNLLKTYEQIAKSNAVIEGTAQKFPQYSAKEIKKMIDAVPKLNTLILELSVKCGDSIDAENIANVYADNFIKESFRVLPAGELTVLNKAQNTDKPVSPNNILNISIAFFLGLIGSIELIFLLEYMDTKIRTEEQIKKLLNMSVLTVIAKD